MINWCAAKGKPYKDYFAAVKNWAKKEHEENVKKGWVSPKTPIDRYNPYAHLTGGA
ncbi:hypothetical protein [Dyadobacter frigoris]|uniref:hypothetical protein n=1 Tax=Dyadobacter frigoris TaxID=2576211 RepID=UPI001485B7B7|nr:hypothetical protein [Dyadobacter frigoris]